MGDKLSYTEFLKIFERQKEYSANKSKDMEQAEAVEQELQEEEEIIQEMSDKSESDTEIEQINEATNEDHITKLCRICGGRGQIDLFSTVCDKYLTIPRSRYAKLKDVQISAMVSDISSEPVEKDDGLPEFICIHCLGYLQHSYNLRLAIKTTAANFREIRKIATEESLQLELNQPRNLITVNQREIIAQKEELEDDKYWVDNFEKKNAKVKISTARPKDKPIINEMKCPSCFRKRYSVKTLNAHMEVCLLAVFERFFSEFKSLYANRFARRITENEYVIYVISLLFNYIEKIKNIAPKNEINIDAVVKTMPPPEVLIWKDSISSVPQPSTSTNPFAQRPPHNSYNNNNRFNSPDYGYSSNQ